MIPMKAAVRKTDHFLRQIGNKDTAVLPQHTIAFTEEPVPVLNVMQDTEVKDSIDAVIRQDTQITHIADGEFRIAEVFLPGISCLLLLLLYIPFLRPLMSASSDLRIPEEIRMQEILSLSSSYSSS